MTKDIKINTSVSITATFELDEKSLLALDALAGYGIESFLKVFYSNLGSHYLQPYEAELRSLFKQINSQVRPSLEGVRNARKELTGNIK